MNADLAPAGVVVMLRIVDWRITLGKRESRPGVGRQRTAFTLIELLVAIAIIGILAALLLPAVQASREAARNIQCRNHLKQISLACHNYLSVHNKFPGYAGEHVTDRDWSFSREEGVDYFAAQESRIGTSWIAQILPFMERGAIIEQLRDWRPSQGNPWRVAGLAELVRTPIAEYYCPTRRAPKAYPGHNHESFWGWQVPRTDYAMNAGGAPPAERRYDALLDGIWVPGWRVGAKDVTDGLSKTYLVGEKSLSAEFYEGYEQDDVEFVEFLTFSDATIWGATGAAEIRESPAYTRFAVRQVYKDRINNCEADCHAFGSAHRGGWNVAMADGSIHTQAYGAHPLVHQAQGSIAGGETVSFEY